MKKEGMCNIQKSGADEYDNMDYLTWFFSKYILLKCQECFLIAYINVEVYLGS